MLKVLILFIFSVAVHSFELVKDERGFLLMGDCSIVEHQANFFRDWSNSLGEVEKNCGPKTRQDNGQCIVNLTSCAPKVVLEYHDKSSQIAGPNCYNLALVSTGLAPALRGASAYEFKHLIESPLCQKVANNQPLRPGDVGAVRGEDFEGGGELHAFIHVSQELVFSKNSREKIHDYRVQNFEDALRPALNAYRVNQMPRRCREVSLDEEQADCRTFIEYFRCRSVESYLKDHDALISSSLKLALSKLNELEVHSSLLMLNSFELISNELERLLIQSGQLSLELSHLMKNKVSNSEEDQVIELILRERLEGLIEAYDFDLPSSMNISMTYSSINTAPGSQVVFQKIKTVLENLQASVSQL